MAISIEAARREVQATDRIRSRYPDVGQRTLARRIKTQNLGPYIAAVTQQELRMAGNGVPEATIYNRIRRYDARQRAARAEVDSPHTEPSLV